MKSFYDQRFLFNECHIFYPEIILTGTVKFNKPADLLERFLVLQNSKASAFSVDFCTSFDFDYFRPLTDYKFLQHLQETNDIR